ncbi:MAG: AI-2E family transporter [Vulcanimicrobiaceae bacterium]
MNTGRRPAALRRSRAERRVTFALKVLALVVLAAIALSAVLDFLGRVSGFAVIMIGAIFFTYVIFPAVRWLNQRLPVVWSIVLVYLAILIVGGFGAAVVVPALASDAQSLVKAMPSIVHNAQSFFSDPNNPVVAHLPGQLRDYLAGLAPQAASLGETYAGAAASRFFTLLLSTVAVVATVIVIPVISVYIMLEATEIECAFLGVVPPRARAKTLAIMRDLDHVLGGFIRGQLTVGATIGAAITVVLLIMHIRYAVLIGVVAGLFDAIPYVGAVVAFVPSVLLALFNDGWQHAAIIAVAFVVIFQLEGHVIAPKIVSDSVGLSPLTVIIAILIGAELAGIGGMFVAVPIAAALRVLIVHLVPRYPIERAPDTAAVTERPVPARVTESRKAGASRS